MNANCVRCGHGGRKSPGLMCEMCQEAEDKINKAKQAIQYVLSRIRDDSAVGWYFAGTESFHLLTEAAAALWNEPVDRVRKMFEPRNPKAPKEGA